MITTMTSIMDRLTSMFFLVEGSKGCGLPRTYHKKVVNRQKQLMQEFYRIQDAILQFQFQKSQMLINRFVMTYRKHTDDFDGATYSLVSRAKTETYRSYFNACDTKIMLTCATWVDKPIENRDLAELLVNLDIVSEQLVARFKWEVNYLRELYQDEVIAYSSQTLLN